MGGLALHDCNCVLRWIDGALRDETRVKKRVRFNNLSSRRETTREDEDAINFFDDDDDEVDDVTSTTSRIETEETLDEVDAMMNAAVTNITLIYSVDQST